MFNLNTREPVYWVVVDWRIIIRTFPPVILLKNSKGTMLTSVPWVLQTVLRVWWISSESHSGQMWVLRCSVGWVFLGLTASGSILVHCSADSDRCWCYYLCFPFLPAGTGTLKALYCFTNSWKDLLNPEPSDRWNTLPEGWRRNENEAWIHPTMLHKSNLFRFADHNLW